MVDVPMAATLVEWMKEQQTLNALMRSRIEMLEAHSENLIQRVYELESRTER